MSTSRTTPKRDPKGINWEFQFQLGAIVAYCILTVLAIIGVLK